MSLLEEILSFESHDFQADDAFQNGLQNILKGDSFNEQKILEAKLFYYNRFIGKEPISIQQYKEYIEKREELKTADPEIDELPEDLTFSQVVERIQNNKPIGGIKNIPDKISDAEQKPPSMTPLKKPWESQTVEK
ncbi:hypothetical protein BB559_002585 [Furculomyces boomerangus]|uniref:Uncharacterized protein n=2 Tax=Harpellales TaxID=61421 RepID=A0A2T9YU20_9FUNG|nr:hypothetical protein BB559_002585 [Furculomyces boomerangus]PWA01572.1 hypothetical protein BB558_002332 [Smittium angustum]